MPQNLLLLQTNINKNSTANEKELYRSTKAEYDEKNKNTFIDYLYKILKNSDQSLLLHINEDNSSYIQKSIAIYEFLRDLELKLSQQNKDTHILRQAMVDLVFTVGFGNQSTLELLKSANGLDKIQGLNQLWSECDSLAEQLGFAGHFVELKQKLRIEFPTGLSKNMDFVSNIQNLEKQVLAMPFTTRPTETIRVRSLSIQESPFRSCLGLDCSTRTYFDKALDPNYIYFTMTTVDHKSSGHATVVLGTATDPRTGAAINVAFLDKLQNIPIQKIDLFLEAIDKSISEKGYRLAIPTDLGKNLIAHAGLSNMDIITDFIQTCIIPRLQIVLTKFTPHSHQYNFENKYSRADHKLDVLLFSAVPIHAGIQIQPGIYPIKFWSDKDLDKKRLAADFLNLKYSTNEEDLLKFVKSKNVVLYFDKLNIYSKKDFYSDLNQIISNKNISYRLRKATLFELFLIGVDKYTRNLRDDFSNSEIDQIISEIKQWEKSNDSRKKKAFENLANDIRDAIRYKNVNLVRNLILLVDVNSKDSSGVSVFHWALKNVNQEVIDIFLNHPRIDFHSTDNYGSTVLMIAICDIKTVEMLDYFLKIPSININAKNNKGYSTLHFAIYNNRLDFIKMLVTDPRFDKTALDTPDNEGITPLGMAVQHGNRKETISLLKRYGATMTWLGRPSRMKQWMSLEN